MHAMRVARAYTGRNKIVKFEGQYHGVHDYALISVTPGRHVRARRRGQAGPAGLGPGHPGRRRRHDHPGPLQQHRPPAPAVRASRATTSPRSSSSRSSATPRGSCRSRASTQAMRALTEEFGILLIFDEVKTGFRFAKGGAAEFFGITPDLATFAKAMGNGYPAAAFGGRREVMSVLPDKVSHGGTYAGNRVAAAAAVKTLEILRDTNALETIHATGPADPGRPPRGPQPDRASRTSSPATRRCSGSCSPSEVADRVPRLGQHRPRAVRRGRDRHARPRRDARAGQPRAVVHVRGARRGRHGRPGRLDLRGLARRRARGAGPTATSPSSRGEPARRADDRTRRRAG